MGQRPSYKLKRLTDFIACLILAVSTRYHQFIRSGPIIGLATRDLGTFSYTQEDRQRFRTGLLWRDWAELYPQLFDADDLRIAKTQAKNGAHFFEWLAAILIFAETGHLSLIEKYEFKTHPLKQDIVKRLLPDRVLEVLKRRNRKNRVQCPDLLVYAADYSDWYFCEVKGDSDYLRKVQLDFFEKLAKASGKPIALLKFVKCKGSP